MTTKNILNQVLYLNNVEQQGIAVSGLFETIKEFVSQWFGANTNIVVGGFENDREYFYSYNEPLKGVADMILKTDDSTVYLYMIED